MAIKLVEQQVELFRSQATEELWKRDHEEAMRVLDFEEVVAFGVACCNMIHRLDEGIRLRELRDEIPYDESRHTRVQNLYVAWLAIARSVERTITKLESSGWEISGAVEFRSCTSEVEGLLTPDDKFFAGEKLARLIDQARKDYESGHTEPMDSMCD
ncbi:MAG: hypothetical protein U1E76_19675 [Planctomycetota bacterium]